MIWPICCKVSPLLAAFFSKIPVIQMFLRQTLRNLNRELSNLTSLSTSIDLMYSRVRLLKGCSLYSQSIQHRSQLFTCRVLGMERAWSIGISRYFFPLKVCSFLIRIFPSFLSRLRIRISRIPIRWTSSTENRDGLKSPAVPSLTAKVYNAPNLTGIWLTYSGSSSLVDSPDKLLAPGLMR